MNENQTKTLRPGLSKTITEVKQFRATTEASSSEVTALKINEVVNSKQITNQKPIKVKDDDKPDTSSSEKEEFMHQQIMNLCLNMIEKVLRDE